MKHHESRIDSDPQSNPVKLLAYDISKAVEERSIAFRDIESLVKSISDESAIRRARRLHYRAGVRPEPDINDIIRVHAVSKAEAGFDAFKSWAESAGQGIVLTAHPTFSLSSEVRDTLGEIATAGSGECGKQTEHLKTLPFLQKSAPTLQEEHVDTQSAILRIQQALAKVNAVVLDVAAEKFPDQWAELTPCLAKVYSWVGYDIDGRTDIGWADAIRLRLSEKYEQLCRYRKSIEAIKTEPTAALAELKKRLTHACESTERDLTLFKEDMHDPESLIAAANNLTRDSERRIRSTKSLYPLIEQAIKEAGSQSVQRDLLVLRSSIRTFGLGTARIHFRLNSRHVINGVRAAFGIRDTGSDTRTLLQRASEMTRKVKPLQVNFAALELEKNTAHQQMMLVAQIHKYIDEETPIRMLIAECEDSLIPLGMLYLARLYGLQDHLDISPLFETAEALNNGGRIISKMLDNPVYRDYVERRGVFAIQTGFSDAGRFMGQLPATLAIERLQSHLASALGKRGLTDVTAIVFNTHGEGMGRGGHPGDLKDRIDYVMSPWAVSQYEDAHVPLCHETSFQGGDGFLWFQTDALAHASVASIIAARHADRSKAQDDPFYTDRDFSWDVFRTLSAEQEALYNNPDYVNLLGGFGQNLLVPTGSRAVKRASSDGKTETFDPRQIRAIPHNAILQQFGTPANVFYGLGRAAGIDPEKFSSLMENSDRARSLFTLATTASKRANISILTGYGRLFDPGFWISRALSGNEPALSEKCLQVSETLKTSEWRSQITDLANSLRIDMFESARVMGVERSDDDQNLKILHALRLAVIMKMLILATELPAYNENGVSQLDILQRLQSFQIDSIVHDLQSAYPSQKQSNDWVDQLIEKSDVQSSKMGGFPHIAETVIKPMTRGAALVRQISIAITHSYDAFG
ncbi:phosphoenolpyruvate carboxylase [Robiginitomaculum antarcticum]|uniref:phosphoenolpyruvate carboxylase n=1 Tax=Robiginitomaculum antarcticum TaxID=437507 RepID=UPI000363A0DD|nr:phosphoenolpyruvate carboxylase [Robiginitomaculum antarcticum]